MERGFVDTLRDTVHGEVLDTPLARHIYSVDASIYEILPTAVLIPYSQEDVANAVKTCMEYNIPIIGRGAGTGIAGGCIGKGLVIDFSKNLHHILEINYDKEYAIVEPGVVQDKLNAVLAENGYCLGPDTSTGNRATIGGMISNNSSGSHSIRYGKMLDHVLELKVYTGRGEFFHCLEGVLHPQLQTLLNTHQDEIKKRFPHIPRRVSGYNLDALLELPFNLCKLFTGAEGSLGIITEAKVKICKKPSKTELVVLHFDDFIESLRPMEFYLGHNLYALEVIDKLVIEMAELSPSMRGKLDWLKDKPRTLIIAEVEGDGSIFQAEVLKQKICSTTTYLRNKEEIQNVWDLRKAGLGLIQSRRSFSRGIGFLEDVAVHPLEMAAFMGEFLSLLKKHGKDEFGIYGHAGAGCIHLRPFIDLRKGDEVALMKTLMEETADLLLKYSGSLSGEHGDGLVRSWLNERMFGPTIYKVFQEVKILFDPRNLFNPGKVVNGPALDENLRATPRTEIKTFQDFSQEGGFPFAVDMCNGNGQCRKKEGLMCPSYQVTLDERHSTRGRAQSLRSIFNGSEPLKTFESKELYEILDLCLECKGCKTQCPSQVDMAKMKAEFLYHYQEKHGYRFRSRLFAGIGSYNKIASLLPSLSNALGNTSLIKEVLSWVGIHPNRSLPQLAKKRFSSWFKGHIPAHPQGSPILLFVDTFTEYNCPEVGKAAVNVLESMGFFIHTVPSICCARPMISKGFLKQARKKLQTLTDRLGPYVSRGMPIIGLEPSCILTLKDDLPSIVPGNSPKNIAAHCHTFEEFLIKHSDKLKMYPENISNPILIHTHCHQKALTGSQHTLDVLKKFNVKEIPSGCCGMAGSFGYEKEHYELSHSIAQLKLLPALQAQKDALIIANGFSCRSQIEHFSDHRPIHLASLLLNSIYSQKNNR